jgi:PAS domain-containing protein
VFGAVTILSGGRALFGILERRAELGNLVSFVLWFNFLVGFVYILAETGMISVARDVTARKTAEDSLQENEQKYRSLFEESNDAIL